MTAGIPRSAKTVRPDDRRFAGAARRRWPVLVLGLVLAVVCGIAAVSNLSLQGAAARQEIKARLGALTGLPVTIEGTSDFTLLPRAALTLTKIRIGSRGSDADAVLEIDALSADLDLWQALLGRTRIKRLTVLRPELLSTSGFMADSSSPGSAASTPGRAEGVAARAPASGKRDGYLAVSKFFGAFLSRFGDLSTIEVRDGVFRMAGGTGGLGISNANIVVSWPSPRSAARMSGSYVWNGEPTEIDLRLGSPIDFLEGRASPVDLDLSSPPMSASFVGQGAVDDASGLAGKVRLGIPSLPRSVRWLGDSRAVLPDFGPMSIEADLAVAGGTLNLRNANVSLDGFAGQGAMEMLVKGDGKPSIGGTLAFDQLDLVALAQAIAPLPENPLDLQRRISVDFLDHLDLDLRLSASRASIGALPVEDLAATVKFKDGIGTLDVGDASVLDGSGQGRLSIDARVANPVVSGFATLTGIDTPALFAAAGVSSFGISGRSNIDADIKAPAATWADFFKRNRVTLDLSASGGALSGFDPNVFLAEGTKSLAPAASDATIPFQALRARLRTSGSFVDLQTVSIKGLSGEFLANGVLSTTTSRIDVAGTFRPAAAGPAAAGGAFTVLKPIAFRMRGDWPRPDVTSGPPPVKPI